MTSHLYMLVSNWYPTQFPRSHQDWWRRGEKFLEWKHGIDVTACFECRWYPIGIFIIFVTTCYLWYLVSVRQEGCRWFDLIFWIHYCTWFCRLTRLIICRFWLLPCVGIIDVQHGLFRQSRPSLGQTLLASTLSSYSSTACHCVDKKKMLIIEIRVLVLRTRARGARSARPAL